MKSYVLNFARSVTRGFHKYLRFKSPAKLERAQTTMVYTEKYGWMHDPIFMDSLAKMRADAERYSEHVKFSIAEAKKQHAEYLQYGHGKCCIYDILVHNSHQINAHTCRSNNNTRKQRTRLASRSTPTSK
jgi:hypothetical protein